MDRNASSANERLLCQQVAAGDEKAFAILIERYWRTIYGQALAYIKSSHHAQDIVQEVFIKLWEKRQALMNVEHFDAYLFIIARNHIISELRKKVALPLEKEVLELVKEEGALPDKQLSFKQLQQHVATAVNGLPAQQKTAYLLSREQGLSFEAIAGEMGLSKETVKKHICRALNAIRLYVHNRAGINILLLIFFFIYHRLLK
jgi:RNA polymerase sigma-70 factor (ECF subfamily)